MKVDNRDYYDFSDVHIRPQLSTKQLDSRSLLDPVRTFKAKESGNRPKEWTGVPIIAANMDTIGTFQMAKELFKHQCCTALHKHYPVDDLVKFFIENEENEHLLFYTMGINGDSEEKFTEFISKYGIPKNICVDVANGYSNKFIDYVAKVRDLCSESMIMAGNVVTGDATYALLRAGASIVKVGIGSGSACLTRSVTGVGMPQLSAVLECANAAHGMDGLICSDGGCVEGGDINKAFGGGADFVMLGGMLSGHDECGGKIIYDETEQYEMIDEYYIPNYQGYNVELKWGQGNIPTDEEFENNPEIKVRRVEKLEWTPNKFAKNAMSGHRIPIKTPIAMEFYGMSSDTAMEKHNGGMASYKASEGRTLQVPYRGPVSGIIEKILGGLRSAMTYVGAENMHSFARCVQFIPVRQQLNTSLAKYEKD